LALTRLVTRRVRAGLERKVKGFRQKPGVVAEEVPAPAGVTQFQVAEPATLFLSLLSGMAYLPRSDQQLLDVTPEGGLLCQGLFTERLLHPVLHLLLRGIFLK
jgi:hypothetical protein